MSPIIPTSGAAQADTKVLGTCSLLLSLLRLQLRFLFPELLLLLDEVVFLPRILSASFHVRISNRSSFPFESFTWLCFPGMEEPGVNRNQAPKKFCCWFEGNQDSIRSEQRNSNSPAGNSVKGIYVEGNRFPACPRLREFLLFLKQQPIPVG